MEIPDRQKGRPSKGVILITDDNPNNIRILHGMLEDEGYSVRVTLNGDQAMKSIRADLPDLLLLDINMPGMNGYEVCKKLKASEETSRFPVIFISALDSPVDKVTAFSCGGVDYIAKPFQINEVIARVETHLHLSRLQNELETIVAERTTELQKTLQALEAAHKRLDLLNRTRSDFLSMISHEMRTPLNGILGLTDLIIDGCVDEDMLEEIRTMYMQAKTRMLNLLNDSMQLDRLDIKDGDVVRDKIPAEHLLNSLREDHEFPGLTVAQKDADTSTEKRFLNIDEVLILKSLHTIARMTDLCRNAADVNVVAKYLDDRLELVFPLLHCKESEDNLNQVFHLESSVRNRTQFDTMGLSPVVTMKTLSLFDGKLQISRSEEEQYPEIRVSLPLENGMAT